MTFRQWEEMPAGERRHRIWLWLMDQQTQRESSEKQQRDQWDDEIARDMKRLANEY